MDNRGGRPRLAYVGRPACLHSWKEIAGYLGRDERTVRRWEKGEGLPIHRLQHGKSGSVFADTCELDAWAAARTDVLRKRADRPDGTHPLENHRVFWPSLAALSVLLITAGLLAFRSGKTSSLVARPAPLTSDPGLELEPCISTDGKHVAYVWDGEGHDNFDIYVRPAAGGDAVRLTSHPAHDYSPTWSADGSSLAFLRQTDTVSAAVVLIPAAGGPERTITEIPTGLWPTWERPGRFLAWSRDGKWLVVTGRDRPEGTDRLFRIAVATGESRPLTSPPKSTGDTSPAISPDEDRLAFVRRISWGVADLCIVPLSRNLLPAGEVRTLHTGWTWNASPVWHPNGRVLIFSTGRMDSTFLARIAASGSAKAERLHGIGDYGWHPSVARMKDGRMRMVYTEHFESVNIWRLPLDGRPGPASELISSAHWSYEPDYSPDGKQIAFLADRSGYVEVWVADASGGKPRQWTFLRRPGLGAPRWSPDGRRIAFTAPGQDGSSIFVVDRPGVAPRRVPGSEWCGYLAWSRDGRALYFNSNRGGTTQIWKVATEGGEAVLVTSRGGRVPSFSSDGRFLFHLRLGSAAGDNDLFRIPVAGGNEEKILAHVDAYSVCRSGIAFKFYRTGPKQAGPELRFYRFATGKTERLPRPAKALRYGIAISPDGRYLLSSQADFQVSDLKWVDGLI